MTISVSATGRLGPLPTAPSTGPVEPGANGDTAGFASLLRQTRLDALRADPPANAAAPPPAAMPTPMTAARAPVPPVDKPLVHDAEPAAPGGDAGSAPAAADADADAETSAAPAASAERRPTAQAKGRADAAPPARPSPKSGEPARPSKASTADPAEADDAPTTQRATAAPPAMPLDPAGAAPATAARPFGTGDTSLPRDAGGLGDAGRRGNGTDTAATGDVAATLTRDDASAAGAAGPVRVGPASAAAAGEGARFAAALAGESNATGGARVEAPSAGSIATVDGAPMAAAAALATPSAPTAAADPSATAATAAPATASIAAGVDTPDFAQALGLRLGVLVRDGIQQAELQLNPPEMGPVSVQIALDGTQARIDFGADAAATRRAIEAGLPQLASALQDAGFTLAGGGVSQHGGGQAGGQRHGRAPAEPAGPGTTGVGSVATARVEQAARRLAGRGGVDLYA